MGTISTEQARTECIVADLELWGAGIRLDGATDPPVPIVSGRMTYPPCLGCRGPVLDHDGQAIVINPRAKAIRFRPCGCVLTVTDMPEDYLQP